MPSSHTEAPPATLSEAGQQEAPTSAASEKVEEEGNVISVHCTASLWRRGTSIPHGYLCSTVFPQSAPSSRLLTPQEKNTEKQNHALPKKKKEKRKKKLRTKRRSVAKKERTPFLSTGFKAHCNDDKEKEEEKQAGRGAKRATTQCSQRTQTTTQQHLFPRRAWNFERDAVSRWEQGHV